MSCGNASSLKRDARMTFQSKIWSGVNWVCGQFPQKRWNITDENKRRRPLKARLVVFSQSNFKLCSK
ncbi:hypothetical protein TNCT_203771 [Trichonephila clavata]|uniref:Uncharacterized protein n=1 Tax=Trichonephila clavata TaxID=2740835 RepID=A0A8X6GQM2_TRICU|nr:hypothetical protein TNCT_203771 [Trichonephila clavata]